jgi:DNA polymerase-3 subunit gamma/tau
MRDAESTLDQLISFCGEKIEEPDVLSMVGLTAQSQIVELARSILAGEAELALRELNDLAKHGKDLSRLLSDVLNHFRNLLIYQVSRGDLKLLEVSEAEAAALAAQAKAVPSDALTRIMEVLTDAEARLREAGSKKTLIEVALLKAIEARNAVSLDSVLQQLNLLRGHRDMGLAAAPARSPELSDKSGASDLPKRAVARPAETATPIAGSVPASAPLASQPAATTQAAPVSSDIEALWSQLIEAVGRVSPFTRSYLLEAHPVSFSKSVFTIGFDPEFEDHIGLVDTARNHTLLQTKLQELGHAGVQFKFVKAEAPVGRVAPMPPAPNAVATAPSDTAPAPEPKPANGKAQKPFSKDDFKNDPLIQKALEIFKGQIVEVRA